MMIGDRIKDLRKELKMSQAEFAAKVKISQPMVVYWENGSRPASAKAVAKICKAFKLKELYFETSPPMNEAEIEHFVKDFSTLDREDQEHIRFLIHKFTLLAQVLAK